MRPRGVRLLARAARGRDRAADRSRRRARRVRDGDGRLDRDPRRPPRARGRAGGRSAGPAPHGAARPGRRARARDRRVGHARQDDRHGDDGAHARGDRPRARLRDRGRAARRREPNAAWGEGEWLVLEADESDRSFLRLRARDRGGDERGDRSPHDVHVARSISSARSTSSSRWFRMRARRSCGSSFRCAFAPGATTRALTASTRGQLSATGRRRGGRCNGTFVVRLDGRDVGPRCDCRCRASTTC